MGVLLLVVYKRFVYYLAIFYQLANLLVFNKLPFLSKSDLRDAYPYGLLAKPIKDCVRIHSTSGTTGKRVVAFYTQNDIDLWDDCCARAIVAAGGSD